MSMSVRRFTLGIAALVPLGVWFADLSEPQAQLCAEQQVRPIPLSGLLATAEAEISGIAWHGDRLVLLPQYPERVGGVLYTLDRAELDGYLAGHTSAPLTPRTVPFDMGDLAERIAGFEGFEAIAFDGENVFFTVEAEIDERVTGYIVRGHVDGDLAKIVLDGARVAELPAQSALDNMGYETLLVRGGELLSFYEVNGENANPHPHAKVYDRDLHAKGTVPFAHLEYRMTDATTIDDAGRFWAVNFFWPGEHWEPASCPLTRRFGLGASHARTRTVERLVELQYTPSGISLTDSAPILLELAEGQSRNWEGIVRFGDEGFLVMTDEHPTSILGYVARPR